MQPKSVKNHKLAYFVPCVKVFSANIEFPNGRKVVWHYPDVGDVVAVLPVDKQKNVYLVKEWRLAWKKEVLQLPAGVCSAKTEKGRIRQVRNELREEIGMDAKKITKMITCYGSAVIRYQPHIYLATDIFPSPKPADEDEYIEVVKMPFAKAYKLFLSGKELTTTATVLAFLLAKEKLGLKV